MEKVILSLFAIFSVSLSFISVIFEIFLFNLHPFSGRPAKKFFRRPEFLSLSAELFEKRISILLIFVV